MRRKLIRCNREPPTLSEESRRPCRRIFGAPNDQTPPVLWGLPVVATTAMTAGTFMVGAFDAAAQIFDRQNVIVELSTESEDDFIKNKVTIRCEAGAHGETASRADNWHAAQRIPFPGEDFGGATQTWPLRLVTIRILQLGKLPFYH
jgi:capsid protein